MVTRHPVPAAPVPAARVPATRVAAAALSATIVVAAALGVAVPAQADTGDNGHNPPGNNGTVFIHDVAGDHHPHNVPHVGCEFWADFFGFDQDQQVTVSFTGQAPTGKDVNLGGGWGPGVISTTDAGGAGNDFDKELAFTADQLGVGALGAPAHQGYHVTMTVATGEPGGKKSKVFWIEPCAAGQAAAGQSTSNESHASESSSTNAAVLATSTAAGSSSTTNDTSAVLAGQPAAVLGERLTAPTSSVSGVAGSTSPGAHVLGERITRDNVAQVLGARLARATSLPFTGVVGVIAMSLLGALLTAIGALVTVTARRRRPHPASSV